MPSLHRGGNVFPCKDERTFPLLDVEKADTVLVLRREENVPLLHVKEADSFLYAMERDVETQSSLCVCFVRGHERPGQNDQGWCYETSKSIVN